jgi:NAD(P)-dependent dehydrogenase (short-subunit alcohol dehydrogenase family)
MSTHAHLNGAVLITGCSSGIGYALCEAFHNAGERVVATARHPETLGALREKGIRVERLDVTLSDDIRDVVGRVAASEGGIAVLVNNAGYGLIGPLIEFPEEEVRRQFETNLYAPLALARAVAPHMRMAGRGVIINIGSISGLVPTPFAGAYCASKAALHVFSDILRMELSPFGIHVISVQPGGIQTRFGDVSAELTARFLRSDSWYHRISTHILQRAQISQENAAPVAQCARACVAAALRTSPPAVIRVGTRSLSLPLMRNLLPLRVLDYLFKKKFGLNELEALGSRP